MNLSNKGTRGSRTCGRLTDFVVGSDVWWKRDSLVDCEGSYVELIPRKEP